MIMAITIYKKKTLRKVAALARHILIQTVELSTTTSILQVETGCRFSETACHDSIAKSFIPEC
jgi:hypothetical protein